jgi:hypothetical protein
VSLLGRGPTQRRDGRLKVWCDLIAVGLKRRVGYARLQRRVAARLPLTAEDLIPPPRLIYRPGQRPPVSPSHKFSLACRAHRSITPPRTTASPPPACVSEPPSHPQLASARSRRLDYGRGERPVADLIGSRRPSGEASPSGSAMAAAAAADSDPAAAVAAMSTCAHWSVLALPPNFLFPSPCPPGFPVPWCTCVAVSVMRLIS